MALFPQPAKGGGLRIACRCKTTLYIVKGRFRYTCGFVRFLTAFLFPG